MIDTSNNPNYYSGTRWDGDGDGPGRRDDVDDDPDDARRDDDDDGDDFPLPEGSFPGRNLPAGVLFLSVSFPPRDGGGKIIGSRPASKLGQGKVICRRGDGGGPQGPHAGPRRGSRWAHAWR